MNIEKRTRSVREGRVLRDGKGQFVSDPTHSRGIVFGVQSEQRPERAFPFGTSK